MEQRRPPTALPTGTSPTRPDCYWGDATSTTLFRARGFEPSRHLPMCAQAGFRYIELCCYADTADFDWENDDAVAELKLIANDCGVSVFSIHPPDRGNLAALDGKEREIQKDILRRFMDLANELGARSLSCHVGFGLPLDATREAALSYLNDALDELGEHAERAQILLCVESLPGRPADLSNPAVFDLARTRSETQYGVVLDTGHANISADLHGLAAIAGPRLRNLHLNDNAGNGDQHLIPTHGAIDWQQFMRELKRSGYVGPLMLEVCSGPDRDPATELDKCRNALASLRAAAG